MRGESGEGRGMVWRWILNIDSSKDGFVILSDSEESYK
ncbi:hypothetical protein ACVW2L_000403 [Mucilaginibacter sp. HD30]